MIIIKLAKRLIGLYFRHPINKISPKGYNDVIEQRSSLCHIIELKNINDKNGKIIITGQVKLCSGDRWEREKGRKYALKKALSNAQFSRDEREIIWKAYHNRKAPPITPKEPAPAKISLMDKIIGNKDWFVSLPTSAARH